MIDTAMIANIEYTIVGSLLTDASHVGEAVAKLSPEDFGTIPCKGLFEAISTLHLAGAPVEPVSVLKEAGSDYKAAIEETRKYASGNVLYYCDQLLEFTRLKSIQDTAMGIACCESMKEAHEGLDRLNGMMVIRRNIKPMGAADIAKGFFEQLHAKEQPVYLPWGMERLNKELYAELGDFIVVGGYSSAGKTLLSLQFALAMAEKYRVGYFSIETSPQKLGDRLLSHMAQVPLAKIKRRDINEADHTALVEAADKLHKLPMEFIQAGGMTVRDIQAVTLSRRYQIAFIDYLQLVEGNGKSLYEKVTGISMGLHTMAQQNGVVVIALSQLSRPEKTGGKMQPPNMSSFRESGQIEQDADIAFLLYPADPNDNKSQRILKLGKNKEGEKFKIDLDFDGATQTLTPAKPSPGEQYRAVHKAIREANRKNAEKDNQVTFEELDGEDKEIPF